MAGSSQDGLDDCHHYLRRIDPWDGHAYRFDAFRAHYGDDYTPSEIDAYWGQCVSTKTKKKRWVPKASDDSRVGAYLAEYEPAHFANSLRHVASGAEGRYENFSNPPLAFGTRRGLRLKELRSRASSRPLVVEPFETGTPLVLEISSIAGEELVTLNANSMWTIAHLRSKVKEAIDQEENTQSFVYDSAVLEPLSHRLSAFVRDLIEGQTAKRCA